VEWTFSEAQRGKDALDCHFSYIKKAFEKHVDHGGNTTSQEEMFKALSDSKLKNTSVLHAETTHTPMQKFTPPKKLGVQRVHQCLYKLEHTRKNPMRGEACMSTECRSHHLHHSMAFTAPTSDLCDTKEVVQIRHHNGVDTHKWECGWSDIKIVTWLQTSKFKRVVATLIGSTNRSPVRLQTLPKIKSHHVNHAQCDEVSPWERQIVSLACTWAQEFVAEDIKTAKLKLDEAEPPDVASVIVGDRCWAMKKNLPPVRTPIPLKKLLIKLYNKVPHVPPESAVSIAIVHGHEDPKDDMFVRHMITSARVKQCFGTLKEKKKGKDGVFGVDESEAISQGKTCKCGGVREMRALIKIRNTVVVGGLSRLNKPALEQMPIDADNGLADGDEWATDNAASELGCDAASERQLE
jgi:hypothetical protein